MSAFLWVCLAFFGSLAMAGITEEFPEGDALGQFFVVFLVIMTVWAAGLLLQPVPTL